MDHQENGYTKLFYEQNLNHINKMGRAQVKKTSGMDYLSC